jgi:NAD-dependent dihydropyrimidine dehydrogenase PreA subunit
MADERPLHYVCTIEEATALVAGRDRFWVSTCGCRERKGKCERSHADLCLQFAPVTAADPTGHREIAGDEVAEILREAFERRLVPRPFRGETDRTVTEGICFCCDDCCSYFLNPEERCDQGEFIEVTDPKLCGDCLACVPVCHFGARLLDGRRLRLVRDLCYGCGLCVQACPSFAVRMGEREAVG